MKITKEILYKATTKPGRCTQDEIYCAINFLTRLKEHQGLFEEAAGFCPQGEAVQCYLDDLGLYINNNWNYDEQHA